MRLRLATILITYLSAGDVLDFSNFPQALYIMLGVVGRPRSQELLSLTSVSVSVSVSVHRHSRSG